MKRLILPIVVASCVVAASGLAGAAEQKPAADNKPKEEWYKILIKGRPVGYIRGEEKYEEYEGRKVRHATAERQLHVPLAGWVVKYISIADVHQELDGQLIKMSMTTKIEFPPDAAEVFGIPESADVQVALKDGVLKTNWGSPSGKIAMEINVPDGAKIYVQIDEWLMKRHGIGPGKVAEFQVYSLTTMQLETETVEKVERIKYVHNGKKIDAFRVTITCSDRKNVKRVVVVSTDYSMLKATMGKMVFVRSNKKDALANVPAVQVEIKDDIPDE